MSNEFACSFFKTIDNRLYKLSFITAVCSSSIVPIELLNGSGLYLQLIKLKNNNINYKLYKYYYLLY